MSKTATTKNRTKLLYFNSEKPDQQADQDLVYGIVFGHSEFIKIKSTSLFFAKRSCDMVNNMPSLHNVLTNFFY